MKDSISLKREKILRDARDEWREAYLKEESDNKRLRDLLLRCIGLLGATYGETNIVKEARAALEGKP